jgi:hypothetical protein
LVITANLATIEARKDSLQEVVDSLRFQVDKVRVYGNDYQPELEGDNVEVYTGPDYTDNAKFFWLPISKGIYLSCDDDIIYPPDYVETIVKGLKKYPNTWVTFHGRRLKGLNLPYYSGHDSYPCLRTVPYDYEIHVAGTGVSAFHTDTIKFDPLTWNEYKMADIMASLELAKKGVRVICLAHKIFWLKITESSKNQSIFISERRNSKRQDELANVIYELVSRNK